uniref:Protein NDUFAF4 homolog n=1 Tax=Glossina brevipalpis TaxID=37001 RepID=A0A1A9WW74_9MUSC
MGQVASFMVRKMNRFNVENRAQRVLEKDKPTPAPKYESNLRDMERTMKLDPTFLEKLNTKDIELDQRLKNVYVTSKDSYDVSQLKAEKDRKDLPTDRSTPEDFEYGYQEPKRITVGRCTLRQALEFLTYHQDDPETWTAQKIADDYKMKAKLVEQILYHFKTHRVFIPDEKSTETILVQAKRKLLMDKPKPKDSSN